MIDKSKAFFSKIVYSLANEDSTSERRALALTPKDDVLTITGSGARALDLLVDSPNSVTSIDFNQTQNFLLELKICALKYFSNQKYLEFIGLRHATGKQRLNDFHAISFDLSTNAQKYWQKNLQLLENGVLFCGTWEKYLSLLSILKFIKKKTLVKLWNASSLEEQKQIWLKEWKGSTWSIFLKCVGFRWVWKTILKEPGIEFIDKKFPISKYLEEKCDLYMLNNLMRDSFFAEMIFFGTVSEGPHLPIHLQEDNLDLIRKNLHCITIVHSDLKLFLKRAENKERFTAFSVSDFSSYASEKNYKDTWDSILHAAKPDAKVCERQFLVKYPPSHPNFIIPNKDLETDLNVKDKSIIYSFNCLTIQKDSYVH